MESPQQKIFRAPVLSSEMVASDVKKITFTLNEPFSFSAGQYVWVEIPKMKYSDVRGERRAFSIESVPNGDNSISILARNTGSGYKKSLFELVTGDNVVIHGPFGSTFVLDESMKEERSIVMIAGGVGISAFMSVLETIKAKSLPVRCFLIYLNTNEEGTPLLSELEGLKQDNGHFQYVAKYDLFSREDVKDTHEKAGNDTEWWVSGSQAMVNHVYVELSSEGISSADMKFENYYPSHEDDLLSLEIKEQLKHESLLVPAIENSITHTIITDRNGIILFANDAVVRNTGYSREEILGNTPRLWGGMMGAAFYKDFWADRLKGETFIGEMVNRRKNGEFYYVSAHITPIFGKKKEVIGFIGTEDDITDIEKLNKAKSEFVSIASHQLRSPLTSINWHIEMLQSGRLGDLSESQKKYFKEIYQSSKRMVKLVNNLLNVSRIEAGKLKVEPETVDIGELVADSLNEISPWSAQEHHHIDFDAPTNPRIMVSVDKTLMREVIQNVIVNAIQYSPKSDKVKVSVEEKAGECIIAVSDEGIGIPKEDQGKIYDKFFRASNARLVESEGAGIGMYIAKSIMDASGGRIWFESPALFKKEGDKEIGYGTTFYLSIPEERR